MTLGTLCLLGAFGCLLALVLLAALTIFATDDEPPFFVYCVGFVLVVAALTLFAAAPSP